MDSLESISGPLAMGGATKRNLAGLARRAIKGIGTPQDLDEGSLPGSSGHPRTRSKASGRLKISTVDAAHRETAGAARSKASGRLRDPDLAPSFGCSWRQLATKGSWTPQRSRREQHEPLAGRSGATKGSWTPQRSRLPSGARARDPTKATKGSWTPQRSRRGLPADPELAGEATKGSWTPQRSRPKRLRSARHRGGLRPKAAGRLRDPDRSWPTVTTLTRARPKAAGRLRDRDKLLADPRHLDAYKPETSR